MKSPYFDIKDNLYDLTTHHPVAINMLVAAGMEAMKDANQREKMGKNITLEEVLRIKRINVETFVDQLNLAIEESKNQHHLGVDIPQKNEQADIRIEGVLPCPIRVPLMDAFESFLERHQDKMDFTLSYDLKAASMGLGWLKEDIQKTDTADGLADLFISAGFDLFFDHRLIGKFKEQGVFKDLTGMKQYNQDFSNNKIELKDPKGQYAILGVVAAVFLINSQELGEMEMPTSWADILKPEFENRVSLPVADFDLFNAMLLNIFKSYGEEGVRNLARSLFKNMHPSEMVKSHLRPNQRPIVTIMPYFFTKMTKPGGPMTPVWPSDGAIMSPIFMLTKKDKKKELQPFVDFFASKEMGEILSHSGKFPSVHPDVDNQMNPQDPYMWIGWDFIENNDIGQLIEYCMDIFNAAVNDKGATL